MFLYHILEVSRDTTLVLSFVIVVSCFRPLPCLKILTWNHFMASHFLVLALLLHNSFTLRIILLLRSFLLWIMPLLKRCLLLSVPLPNHFWTSIVPSSHRFGFFESLRMGVFGLLSQPIFFILSPLFIFLFTVLSSKLLDLDIFRGFRKGSDIFVFHRFSSRSLITKSSDGLT